MTTGHEFLDHLNLLADVGYGTGLDVRRQEIQGRAVGVKLLSPALREIGERLTGLLGVADGFVIHIGDVSHMKGRGAAELDDSAEDVLRDEGAEVSDVGWAVDRGSAAIEADRFSIDWADGPRGAGESIVKLEVGHVKEGALMNVLFVIGQGFLGMGCAASA
jgi:hypothetical protein